MNTDFQIDSYKILSRQVRKVESHRVSSYAAKVVDAQNAAQDRLFRAQKELKAAKKIVKKQEKAMKKFKKTNDITDLSAFGV